MKKRFALGCLVALALALVISVPNASGQAVYGSILGTVLEKEKSSLLT